jgi:hypothetical protein
VSGIGHSIPHTKNTDLVVDPRAVDNDFKSRCMLRFYKDCTMSTGTCRMVNNLLFTEPLLQQVKTPERHHDRRGGNPTSGKITLSRDDERQIQVAILLFVSRIEHSIPHTVNTDLAPDPHADNNNFQSRCTFWLYKHLQHVRWFGDGISTRCDW